MSAINSKVSSASPLAHSEMTPMPAASQISPPTVQDQMIPLEEDSCCSCLWKAISDFFYNLFCCFLCKKEEVVVPGDALLPPTVDAPTISTPAQSIPTPAAPSTPVVPAAEPAETCPIEPYYYFLGAANYNLKEIKNTWTDVREEVREILRDNAWIVFLDLTSQLHSYFYEYSNKHPECQQALLLAYLMNRGDFSPLLECFVAALPDATVQLWLERHREGKRAVEVPAPFMAGKSEVQNIVIDPLTYCDELEPDLDPFYDIITEFYTELKNFLELGNQGLTLGEGLAFAAGTFVKNRDENVAQCFLDTLYLLLDDEQGDEFVTAIESRDESLMDDTRVILKNIQDLIEKKEAEKAQKRAEAEKAHKPEEAHPPASQSSEASSSSSTAAVDHESSFESSSADPIPVSRGPNSPARRFLNQLNNPKESPRITREMFKQGSQLLGKIVTGNPSMTNWTTVRTNNDEG